MNPKDEKSITNAQHYSQLAKHGIKPKEYAELPSELSYIWRWFCELSRSGFDVTQIDAYFRLKRITPTSTEVDLILSMARAIGR